jgi:hypothetical protein
MGHQWGGNHTFNGSTGSCAGGNRAAAAAYEPGSGITIMAYAGICGTQDLALNSIDTFHVKSLEEIVAYSQTGNGNTCAVSASTGNTPPTVSVVGGTTFNIPKQTPFALTASATDPNGDTLTFDWQQYDLGAATTAVPNNDADGIARPILRPFLPSSSPTRNFPSLTYILNNRNLPPSTISCPPRTNCLLGEQLPNITRNMNFQVVVRDNRAGGGGINTATAALSVDGNSGPFVVTSPSTKVSWAGGSTQLIGWSVANTSAAPISAANVRISLSTDGGQTFPTILSNSTPNDGVEAVTLPATLSSNIRIKVEPVGNVFFDISDVNTKFDFDGDARTDLSVYRDGVWYVQRSQLGFTAATFGIATDKTVAADYDGDGRTDFAIFRDGVWYVLRSRLGIYVAQFGAVGDIPVPGDYNGDGRADLAVFRAGVWYIFHTNDSTVRVQQFGNATDKPVVGDFDGDGRQDLAVYRSGTWFALRSQLGSITIPFGIATDVPVPADFDGDGKTDYAVYRNGIWYLLRSQDGIAIQSFGLATDVPTPADFDGDGKADLSVFRNGIWYLQQTTSGFSALSFGLASDKPIPAQSN